MKANGWAKLRQLYEQQCRPAWVALLGVNDRTQAMTAYGLGYFIPTGRRARRRRPAGCAATCTSRGIAPRRDPAEVRRRAPGADALDQLRPQVHEGQDVLLHELQRTARMEGQGLLQPAQAEGIPDRQADPPTGPGEVPGVRHHPHVRLGPTHQESLEVRLPRDGLASTRPGTEEARSALSPRQAASSPRSAYSRIQACIAIAAAAEALIERVEPNCAIEKVPSQASRASSDSPGPSWPKRKQTRRGIAIVSRCCRAGQVVDAEQDAPPRLVEVRRQVGRRLVVPHVLVAVGDHRAAPVPPPVADDVHLARPGTRWRCARRADVEVVLPVLDRDVEVVPPGVEVGDDRLHRPVAIAVDDVAAVALGQQLRVVLLARSATPRPWPDTDLGRPVRHRVVRRPLVGCRSVANG